MNEQKIRKLFAAARSDAAPALPDDFEQTVLSAIRRQPSPPPVPSISIVDELNRLFPSFAMAAIAVVVLALAGDFALSAAGLPDLSDGVSQISSQWLFTGNGY